METINLSDVRQLIDAIDPYGFPVPFSIEYWTADVQRDSGGDYIIIENAVKNFSLEKAKKSGNKFKMKANTPVVQKPMSKLQEHHAEEQTTVIAIMAMNQLKGKLEPTGERKSIHYRLIEKFNNKKVVW